MVVTIIFLASSAKDPLIDFWANFDEQILRKASSRYPQTKLREISSSKDAKRAVSSMIILSLRSRKNRTEYLPRIEQGISKFKDPYDRFLGFRFTAIRFHSYECAVDSIDASNEIPERQGTEGVAMYLDQAIVSSPDIYLKAMFSTKKRQDIALYDWWLADDQDAKQLKLNIRKSSNRRPNLKRFHLMEEERKDRSGFHLPKK